MARLRTIKPEFWTDERIGECSVRARLLFLATLNFADDHGGLDRSAKQLKAQAFPYDQIDCEPLIEELLKVGLLDEYEVGGKKYLHIIGFLKHQKIDKPGQPRFPLYDESLRTHRVFGEESPRTPQTLATESSLVEWNGVEKKDTTAASRPSNGQARAARELEVFKDNYPKRSGAQPWVRALKTIHARLTEGHTWDEILAGATRYRAFCDATGKGGTEYVMQAATFCGPERHFLLPWTCPPKPETASEAILRKLNETTGEVFDHEQQQLLPRS